MLTVTLAQVHKVSLELTCTPTVKLCRVYGNLADIYKMFNIVYRRADFDIDKFNGDSTLDEKGLKIVREILKRRHTSVLEFIHTLWFIECSRVATHELVRHRIASYWQESQRYCISRGFILPRSMIREDIVKTLEVAYNTYLSLVSSCRPFGEDFKQFARYVLPYAVVSRIFVSMNLRELIEVFFPLRMCRRAQAELRYIALKMYLQLREKIPEVCMFTGPRCVIFGRCPEYDITDPDKVRACRLAGYREAIQEHGSEEELNRIDEILNLLP